MKKIVNKVFAFLALGFLFSACEENTIVEQTERVTSGANIRFAVASQDSPSLNFYLNNMKVTGRAPVNGRETGLVWSTALSSATHPASYGYINVPAGSYTLSAIDTTTVPGTTTLRMNEILKTTVQLEEMKNYTSYLVGSGGSYEVVTVRDDIPPYDFSKSYVRFVNVMTGAPGRFTIKAKGTDPVTDTVVVASQIPFKGESGYVAITPGVYNIAVFLEGKQSAYTTFTGGTLQPGRTYTFFTRGTYSATPGTVNRQLLRER